MTAPLYDYDPQGVSLTIGDLILDGYVTGEFVSITRDSDRYTKTKSTLGDTTRNKMHDNDARVTFRCHDGSPINGMLAALADSGKVVAFAMKDNNGTDQWNAPQAWVVRPADGSKAQEAGQNEWLVDLHSATIKQGGLTPVAVG